MREKMLRRKKPTKMIGPLRFEGSLAHHPIRSSRFSVIRVQTSAIGAGATNMEGDG